MSDSTATILLVSQKKLEQLKQEYPEGTISPLIIYSIFISLTPRKVPWMRRTSDTFAQSPPRSTSSAQSTLS